MAAASTSLGLAQAAGQAGGEPGQGPRAGRTLRFRQAVVTATAALAGPTEGRGPLGGAFDEVLPDHLLGEASWERAERKMLARAVERLAAKEGLRVTDYDVLLAGDLLNQTVASSYAARDLDLPFLGLFNACATFAEGLGLAAALCELGACRRAVVAVSSHHDAAERQYRFPTELGNQRPPTAQWTATGAVAVAVAREEAAPALARLEAFTPGRVVDLGVRDPFHMGAAMAPAAADTLAVHLGDLGRGPDAYDAVCTGDLGRVGLALLRRLLREAGVDLPHLEDAGVQLYDPRHQDVHAGGSGAACSALVFAARLLPRLRAGGRRVCLCGTGSLHSLTTYQQGESIPGIAHAVSLAAVEAS